MRRDDTIIEYMPKRVLNRHWLWMFIWTSAGVLLALSAGPMAPVWAAAAGVAGLGALFAPAPISRRSHAGAALLCLALGGALFVARKPDAGNDNVHQLALAYPVQRMVFEGYAANTRVYFQDSNYLVFEMRVTDDLRDGELHPIRGRALVRWRRADGPVFNGARVRVSGRLSPHLGAVNHGVRGAEDHYRSRGVFSAIHATGRGVEVLAPDYKNPRYWASRLRQWQSERLALVTPEAARPFVNGVWLGERSLIDDDEYQQFVRAGTAHVLAVSGMHVGVIALSLNFLLRMIRIPRRARLLLLMFGVFLFAMMAGARTATLRAMIMLMCYYSYEWIDREPDALSTMGICGFGFLVWNPNVLFEPGFLLSFGSVAAILLFYPGIVFLFSRLHRIPAASLAVTFSAQIFTWPVVAWYFHLAPITGILANVVVVPLLTVALWLSFITASLAAVSSSVAMIFGHALLPVITIIQWTNRAAGALPLAYTAVFRPSILALLLYGAAALYFYRALYDAKERRRSLIAMTALLVAAALFWRPASEGAVLDVIDVGHGDALFLRAPGGMTLLVDGGDLTEYTDAGKRIVAPFLYANGVSHLDYVAVSHSDSDHIGGLFHIIENFSVGSVLMGPEHPEATELETAFLERCATRNIPVRRMTPGDTIAAGATTIQAVHPPTDWAGSRKENNRSLVLYAAWRDFSALLTGDVEKEAEARLTETLNLPVSALKVPHHGSNTSSTEAFLRHIRPDVAVVSARAEDSRGPFIKEPVMERYRALDIPLFRTDRHGGIRIRSHHGNLAVTTARGVRGYSLK